MGTRSIVAMQDGSGDGWKGRYCHWDGYPGSMAVQLGRIVDREGVERAAEVLCVKHTYWSSIDASALGSLDDRDAADGRWEAVEGFGKSGPGQNVGADEWIVPEGDKWGTEWLYVLSVGGLLVGRVSWEDSSVELVGLFSWGSVSSMTTADWDAVEGRIVAGGVSAGV